MLLRRLGLRLLLLLGRPGTLRLLPLLWFGLLLPLRRFTLLLALLLAFFLLCVSGSRGSQS